MLVGAALLLYALLKFIVSRWTDRRTVKTEPPHPTFFERAISVTWVAPLRALPPGRSQRARSMAGSTRSNCSMPPGAGSGGAILKAAARLRRHLGAAVGRAGTRASRNGAWYRWPTGRRAASPGCSAPLPRSTPSTARLTEVEPRLLRAADAERGAVVRLEHRLRRAPDRLAADAFHAAGHCDAGAGLPACAALAQAAALGDRHRHHCRGAARLRGAGALRRPAAGADRYRRAAHAGSATWPSAPSRASRRSAGCRSATLLEQRFGLDAAAPPAADASHRACPDLRARDRAPCRS